MARNPKVEVVIAGDPRGINRAFGSAGKAAGRFGRTMGGVGRIAAVGFAAVGAGAIAAGVHLFNSARDLDAWRGKAETVFEDAIGFVDDWAKENAHAMGLTTAEATNAAAGMADLLKPIGFTAEEAANMSTEMTGLSGALAEWSGGAKSAEEVASTLQKALLGETEELKSLGIAISQADIMARLAANGQDELTGAALKQAKAIAVQELILEKSTDAQAAYAEGGDKLQRKQAELSARMRELRDTAAKKLVPAFLTLATFVLDNVVPAIESLAGWLTETLGPAFRAIGEWIGETVVPKLIELRDWLKDKIPVGIDVLKRVWNRVFPVLEGVLSGIADAARAVWEWLGEQWEENGDTVRGILDDIADAAGVLWELMKKAWEEGLRPAFEGIMQFVEDNPKPFIIGLTTAAATGFTLWAIAATAAATATGLAIAPVLLVAVAVGALAGAFIYLQENTKWFPAFINWISTVASVVIQDAIFAIEDYTEAWSLFAALVDWTWDHVLSPFVDFVWQMWNPAWDGARLAVDTVRLAIDLLPAGIQWVIDKLNILMGPLRGIRDLALEIINLIPGVNAGRSDIGAAVGGAGGAVGDSPPPPQHPTQGVVPQSLQAAAGVLPGRSVVTIVNVNVAGSVLSERDLEFKLRDMQRRGMLPAGAAVRTGR